MTELLFGVPGGSVWDRGSSEFYRRPPTFTELASPVQAKWLDGGCLLNGSNQQRPKTAMGPSYNIS